MTSLAELSGLLQACETMTEINALIAHGAPALLADLAGSFYGMAPSHGLVSIAEWGQPPPSQRAFAPSDCWAIRRGRPHLVDRSTVHLRCRHVEEPVGAGQLCVPVVAQGRTWGLLHLEARETDRTGPAFTPELIGLAEMFAEFAALAYAGVALRVTLHEQSTRDPLTGLFNRRYMEDSLDRELARATREGYSLGVIIADIDSFKSFNDLHGHPVGDMVLQLVGRFLRGAVRAEDVACRYGGEEFLVIMPKASLGDTRRRAEAIRLGVVEQSVPEVAPTPLSVTMSLGVAAFPDHGRTRGALIGSADGALYRAKLAGRNRVEVAASRESRR